MAPLVIQGNALALPLAADTVDLIVTSPPYFGLRSYQDGGEHYAGQIGAEPTPTEFVNALIAATAEMVRVLKPSGSIWLNLGDKYSTGNSGQSGMAKLGERFSGGGHSEAKAKRASTAVAGMKPKSLIGIPWRYAIRAIDELGLILRAEVVWSKPNGLPESVTDRVRRSHETWFHFVKQPRYFSGIDEIREAYSEGTLANGKYERKATARAAAGSGASGTISQAGQAYSDAVNPLGKLPGSVWTIATQPLRLPEWLGIDHFAAFPMEWPRRIIKGWAPPSGIVLDPFGGTGTTATVATALDRQGITVDMSSDYCRVSQWRTTDPAQLAKASGTKIKQARQPRKPVSDQPDLFGGAA